MKTNLFSLYKKKKRKGKKKAVTHFLATKEKKIRNPVKGNDLLRCVIKIIVVILLLLMNITYNNSRLHALCINRIST